MLAFGGVGEDEIHLVQRENSASGQKMGFFQLQFKVERELVRVD